MGGVKPYPQLGWDKEQVRYIGNSPSMASGFSRRSLAKQITAAALFPAVAAPQGRAGQAPLPPAEQADVDAQFATVIRKWGDRLSEEQRARVRAAMIRHRRMLMRVREFPIENSDSPALGLRL
jgi:hypothetical protein